MKNRGIVLAVVALVALGAGGWAWLHFIAHPQPVVCGYCLRPLHTNLMVTAEIAGKRTQVCCARCAVTEANQQHRHLRLIEVHDYLTGHALTPEKAWYVEDSRVMACNHDAMRMNEMKDTDHLTFDRCSPGTFAFANKDAADAFVDRNGGNLLSFAQMIREARYQ